MIGGAEWDGFALPGDRHIISASTLAGRVPNWERERWGAGEMLKQLFKEPTYTMHILDLVKDGYETLAAKKLLEYKFGETNADGQTPAERGTELHYYMELLTQGRPISIPTSEVMGPLVVQLMDWLAKSQPESTLQEQLVYNYDMKVGGQLDNAMDLTVKGRRYENSLVDLKTKRKKPSTFYGHRHGIQMASYWVATKMATWSNPRVLAEAGRRYLISPEEFLASEPVPPINDYGFIVRIWPEGWQVTRLHLPTAAEFLPMAIQAYEWTEWKHKEVWKHMEKGGA